LDVKFHSATALQGAVSDLGPSVTSTARSVVYSVMCSCCPRGILLSSDAGEASTTVVCLRRNNAVLFYDNCFIAVQHVPTT